MTNKELDEFLKPKKQIKINKFEWKEIHNPEFPLDLIAPSLPQQKDAIWEDGEFYQEYRKDIAVGVWNDIDDFDEELMVYLAYDFNITVLYVGFDKINDKFFAVGFYTESDSNV